jgi:hypothetical protein
MISIFLYTMNMSSCLIFFSFRILYSMSVPNLIITSPHAKCNLLHSERQCDLAASLAGQTMANEAEKFGLNYFYFPGDVYRIEHDLNRKKSRKTDYRQNLLRHIKKLSKLDSILLDVHSFPNYYMPEAGDINFFRKNEIPPEIVLIQGPLNTYKNRKLTNLLYHMLSKQGIRVKILKGISVNDILNQSAEHHIPGILIEFNESFNQKAKLLSEICKTIINGIIHISID